MALAETFLTTLERIAPVRRGESLAPHTTFRIGGPAAAYVRAGDCETLRKVAALASEWEAPLFVMGGGSNLLVSDKGIPGVVVETWTNKVSLQAQMPSQHSEEALHTWVYCGAPLPRLATNAARAGLAGLEWAVGIPGTVGGAVVNNAGAHGGAISDLLCSVLVWEPQGERTFSGQELGLSYRSSNFRRAWANCRPSPVILAAELALRPEEPQHIQARMAEHGAYRRSTQPSQRSIGSIFKNTPEHPAGWLLEQAGLKGYRIGDAQVSTKHANFIVNRGGATAAAVNELICYAQDKVRVAFGIELEPEIQRVGEGF